MLKKLLARRQKKDSVYEQLKYYSQKVGDVVRQLALGGVAIIWMIHASHVAKDGSLFGTPIANDLRLPIILIVIGLLLDVLHYAFGALMWTIHSYRNSQSDVDSHKITLVVNFVLASLKVIVVIVAYSVLGLAMLNEGLWKLANNG